MTDEPHAAEKDELIYRYTRSQAIEDGVLVDLTIWSRETGFVIPVACTAAVWHGYLVPADSLTSAGQSERGRSHDLLWMLYCAIKRSPAGPDLDRLGFEVIFLMPPAKHQTVRLIALCGPGDGGEPVLTVMLPNED